MSTRYYIAKANKSVSKFILDTLIEQVIEENENYLNDLLVEKLGFTTVLELGDDIVAEKLLDTLDSYIPSDISQQYNLTEEDKIGLMQKEDILTYVRNIHEEMIDFFQTRLNEKSCQPYVCAKLTSWQVSQDVLFQREDEDGHIELPYIVKNSQEYLMLQLMDLYNNTNWKTEDIILYAW